MTIAVDLDVKPQTNKIKNNNMIYLKYGTRREEKNPVFGGLRTTNAQTSLRIRAVWSAHLFFAYWKESYLDVLRAKVQISSTYL